MLLFPWKTGIHHLWLSNLTTATHHRIVTINFCKVFSDSKSSKKISCGKTKSEAIIANILSPHSVEIALSEVKENKPFSLSTDDSNKGNLKLFPGSVRHFSSTKRTTDRLTDFCEDSDETPDEVTAKL